MPTGSSSKVKDKFIWFDVVDPVDVVENDDHEPTLPVSPVASSDLTHTSDTDVDDGKSFLFYLNRLSMT